MKRNRVPTKSSRCRCSFSVKVMIRMNHSQQYIYKTVSGLLHCDSFHLRDSLSSVASFQTDLTNDLTSSWRPTSICSLSRKRTLSMRRRWAFKGTFSWCAVCWQSESFHITSIEVVFLWKYCAAGLTAVWERNGDFTWDMLRLFLWQLWL